jgi:hypothetical protein
MKKEKKMELSPRDNCDATGANKPQQQQQQQPCGKKNGKVKQVK